MTPEEALDFIDNAADCGLGAPDYCEARSIVREALRRISELEQKLKYEAEGHEGWEQEHLRQSGIQSAAFKQIMGLCDPDTAIYRIAKQALYIEP